MENKLTARVLFKAMEVHGWHQGDLQAKTGITRSTISEHLSGQRDIRDEHLICYLGALNSVERPMLLAAWLRDTLPLELIHDLFPHEATRIEEETAGTYRVNILRPEVINWRPELDEEQKDMVAWWSERLVHDPEIDEIFRQITRKAGYDKPLVRPRVAMIVTDAAGLTLYLSPAQEQLCGYTLEEMRGKKPGSLLQGEATEPKAAAEMSAAIHDQRAHECIITNYHRDGHAYRVHIRMFPVYDSLGELIQFRAIEERVG